jgi:carbon monoxide dehydrogenase subunit G
VRIEHRLRLSADRETVWEFVSDVDALLTLLPGVLNVERTTDSAWRVRMRQKVGFIEADFDINVVMAARQACEQIRFRSEGKGVQFPAVVVTRDVLDLRSAGPMTEVTYTSDVQLSGRLAALGHAVMKVKARELIAEFQRKVIERFDDFMVRTGRRRCETTCEPSP